MQAQFKLLLDASRPLVLEQLVSSRFPIVIYGAGYCARSMADALQAEGRPAVCCTVDRRWITGGSRCGTLPVVPLDELHQRVPEFNLAVAIGTARPNWDVLRGIRGAQQVFGNVGMARGLPMTRVFLNEHRDRLEHAYQSLSDDLSRVSFCEYLQSRLFGHTDELPSVYHHNGWFTSAPLKLTPHEIFCDCGAFDGDTLELFAAATAGFKHAYAWEPDQANADKLAERIRVRDFGNTTILRQCAASFRGELRFLSEGGSVSALSEQGDTIVPCDTIDSVCPSVTLIKLDVEGSELDVLKGAEQTITQSRPRIVAAVYHRREDCYSISDYVTSLSGPRETYFRWMRDCPDDVLTYVV